MLRSGMLKGVGKLGPCAGSAIEMIREIRHGSPESTCHNGLFLNTLTTGPETHICPIRHALYRSHIQNNPSCKISVGSAQSI